MSYKTYEDCLQMFKPQKVIIVPFERTVYIILEKRKFLFIHYWVKHKEYGRVYSNGIRGENFISEYKSLYLCNERIKELTNFEYSSQKNCYKKS